jgi:hypothetical protein
MPETREVSKWPCGMLSMLLSGGWGVVPCLRRAGGDVAGSAWRQGASRPHWDPKPVGMFEGPVGFAQLRESATVGFSSHRCMCTIGPPRRAPALQAHHLCRVPASVGAGGVAHGSNRALRCVGCAPALGHGGRDRCGSAGRARPTQVISGALRGVGARAPDRERSGGARSHNQRLDAV